MDSSDELKGELSHYAVLYLDLLGQGQTINALTDLSLLKANKGEYLRRFGEDAGTVWGVRKVLACSIETCLGGLQSHGQEVPRIRLQMFADTVIAYFRFNRKNPNCFLALRAMFLAAARTMILALASKVPMRGGLDCHLATDFSKISNQNSGFRSISSGGDLWGPAPMLAYLLAEKKADYPRILLGEGLSAMVLELAKLTGEGVSRDPESAPLVSDAVNAAKELTNLVGNDPNDSTSKILDYLRYRPRGQSNLTFDDSCLQSACRFAITEREQFAKRGDKTLAERYRKLLVYMESRQVPNGIIPKGTIPPGSTFTRLG